MLPLLIIKSDANRSNVDFIAIKVGDINGNARANSLTATQVRTANTTLTLTTADRFVQKGAQISVPFTAEQINQVTGYQFAMNYDGLQLNKLVQGVAKAEHFNITTDKFIATSWNGTAQADEVLFTLDFTATTSGKLSQLLSIAPINTLAAEAYKQDGDLMNIAIEFTTDDTDFVLEQNNPNPFNAETSIGFTLPKAGAATLTIMDIQGRILHTVTGDYVKGANQITIHANQLNASGLLQYQLEADNMVQTKKMILIE